MRGAFIQTLTELAAHDDRVILLTGDLGYLAVEVFAERWPRRFFNVGVAEQNMVGLATGLAEAGFLPFIYSIVPFAILRPYEFIRNGPVAHQFPVRIVGVGGGVEYASNGLTHYGLEDIAVSRAQPALTVIAPADAQQTRTALRATWDLPGPIYYRLGKDDQTTVPGLEGRFELGGLQVTREGKDLLFIAMGNVASEVAAAAEQLAARGVTCTVAVLASITPAPMSALVELLAQFRVALTVEAHYRVGGAGSLVAECVAENDLRCRVVRCGVHEMPQGITGSQAYLYQHYGLLAHQLAQTGWQAVCAERAQHGN
jgi:transketolase